MEHIAKDQLSGDLWKFQLQEKALEVHRVEGSQLGGSVATLEYSSFSREGRVQSVTKTQLGAYLCAIVGFALIMIATALSDLLNQRLDAGWAYWALVILGLGVVVFGLRTIRDVSSYTLLNNSGEALVTISDMGAAEGSFPRFIEELEARIEAATP